ncbi:hypothetical protein DFP72DRAFT_1180168 [Ephemerocybe angulata]|uniref:Uncharacterized protein n=1 Tax=Ephemerocybe angulata TaxID=980116 RepID=A0A8H6LTI3_9AGAR|nr:hypothetical protein DFP72DRAFT_1180168 [Tulosesus angulatus]
MYNVPDPGVVLPAAAGEKETYILLAVWLAAILYGVYLSLFISAMKSAVRNWGHTLQSQKVFLAGIVLMFVATTIDNVVNGFTITLAYSYGPIVLGKSTLELLLASKRWDIVCHYLMFLITMLTADMLMIYRCWIVWNRDWRVVLLPILLCLVTLSKGIVTLLWTFYRESLGRLSLVINIFLNMCIPAIITQNAICTALIVFKILRQHQISRAAGLRSFGSLVGGGTSSRRAGLVRVARIALENGVIFISHLVILTILAHAGSSASFIFQITLLPSFSMGFIMMYVRVSSARTESGGARLDAQRSSQPVASWVNATSIRFVEPQSLDCPEPPANDCTKDTGSLDSGPVIY